MMKVHIFKKVWTHFALLVLLTRPLLQRFKVLRISTPTICTTQGTWVSTCSFCFWMFLSAIEVVPHTYRVVYLIGSLHFQYWKGKRVEASHSYHSTKSRSNLLFCWLPLYMSGPLIMAGLHWNQRKLTFSPQRSLSSWTVAMGLAPNHLAVMKTLKWLQGVQKIIWLWWKFEMTARVTKHNLAQYRP